MRKKKFNAKKNNKKKMRTSQKLPVRNRWVSRNQKFSSNPYVITVSHYRRNIFFTVSDIEGHTKLWVNSGRCGFKGRDKTNKMAVLTIANLFFKRLCLSGIKKAIFKYKNFNKNRWQIRKAIRRFHWKRRLKLLGFFIQNQISFNGCRAKKKRRK